MPEFVLMSKLLAGSELKRVLDDSASEVSSISSDFWVMVLALKVMIMRDPLSNSFCFLWHCSDL
jgi:hypothetical protein